MPESDAQRIRRSDELQDMFAQLLLRRFCEPMMPATNAEILSDLIYQHLKRHGPDGRPVQYIGEHLKPHDALDAANFAKAHLAHCKTAIQISSDSLWNPTKNMGNDQALRLKRKKEAFVSVVSLMKSCSLCKQSIAKYPDIFSSP